MPLIHIDTEKCLGDGLCLKACSIDLFRMGEDKKAVWKTDEEAKCIQCGHCVAVCPAAAIRLHDMDPEAMEPAALNIPEEQAARLFMSRRSIRHFRNRPVDRGQVEKALHIANYAPTGANRRDVGYSFVDSPDAIARVRELLAEWMEAFPRWKKHVDNYRHGRDTILRGAPLLLTVYADELPSRWGDFEAPAYMSPQACAGAASYLELVLHTMGIGTCWSGLIVRGAPAVPELRQFLGIPEGKMVYAAFLAGYPAIRYVRIPWRKPPALTWV
ncbi:nitroreductase family protein [Mailhella massiliensis]|uniref:Nitroreductase family protein n=1 Tax=Mailhella massiliensis TaxID=1903261 RepID=A0A921AXI9_9BACT|nr:nitroreductase family protein [Mailhella massiliensis]HJD97929.1 nitroreductase family protein [Mailhella massiliensis]